MSNTTFKVGDKVKQTWVNDKPYCDEVGTIVGKSLSTKECFIVKDFTRGADEDGFKCYAEKHLVLIESPKPKAAKWVDSTPHQDQQITLEDGERNATIYHDGNGKYIRCSPFRIPNTKEDWDFVSRVARKIKSFK